MMQIPLSNELTQSDNPSSLTISMNPLADRFLHISVLFTDMEAVAMCDSVLPILNIDDEIGMSE